MLKLKKKKKKCERENLSPKRGCGHQLLHVIIEGCSTVNIFLIMFQFFVIKNGLQLIHSFATISWNPITITAQTTSGTDSQTTRKEYCHISKALLSPSGKYNLFVFTQFGNFLQNFTKQTLTIIQCLDPLMELDFSFPSFDSSHGPVLQHHWTIILPLQLSVASCSSRTHSPRPTCVLLVQILLFQVKPILTGLPIFFHNIMISSRVGSKVYSLARHST